MRMMIPIEEKMKSEAEFGAKNLHYVITLKKADELREMGFIVTDSKEQRNSPRLHKIDWSKAGEKFKDVDIDTLDEKNDNYSLPEKLWIIASKVHKDPIKYYKTH